MTVLYINGEHCTSLKQLKGYFSEDLTPESDIYADLLDYGQHGDIARWLGEKGETELSSKVDYIDDDLSDSAFYALLKAIITGVTDSGLLKPTFDKCFLFEDLKYDVKDTEAKISISLKVLKCVNEEYELSVSCNWGARVMKVNPDNHTEGKTTNFDFFFSRNSCEDFGEITIMAGGIELKRLSKSIRECEDFSVGGVSFKMIRVEGGSFMMGSSDSDSDAYSDEKPQHRVTLSDYYIGETLVTQELWNAVMGKDGNNITRKWSSETGSGNNYPVYCVSYYDIMSFISKLNGQTKKTFRLPTEVEWEYAARGGRKSLGFKYAGSNNIREVAWYDDNGGNKTHPVKQKNANELDLYDMSGNVWEWCGTRWRNTDYVENYREHESDDFVLCGGSWGYDMENSLIVSRLHNNPENRSPQYGFRLAMSME